MTFAESIMRTYDWLSKQLAYFAAFRSDVTPPGLAGLSAHARTNWDDYIGSAWDSRITLYDSTPTVLVPVSDADLNEILQQAERQEVAQLAKIGFQYTTVGSGFPFLPSSASPTVTG
ncbi:MAG: hypothetical protein JWL58_2867 [Streptosporangiaceae bacterium]|jgi:hypothetical protein|nr:hypothetical protein [Streptosporangiaceae bacterium]